MSSLLFKAGLILIGSVAICGSTRSASAHERHAAPPAAAPSSKQFEIKFLKDMIDHHAMAVHMTQVCSTRAEHEELRQLCEEMKTMQQQEIVQMQSWLQSWYGISYHSHMKKSEVVQMGRLEAVNGRAFEIAFMEMMTQHHRQAILEADQCVRRAKHAELKDLCQHMHEMQKSEIAKMMIGCASGTRSVVRRVDQLRAAPMPTRARCTWKSFRIVQERVPSAA